MRERIVVIARQRRSVRVMVMPVRLTTLIVVVMMGIVVVVADEEGVDVIVIGAFVAVRHDLRSRHGGRDGEGRQHRDRDGAMASHAKVSPTMLRFGPSRRSSPS